MEFIKKGLAYVDELTPEQMKEYRGTLTEPAATAPTATAPSRRAWTSLNA